MLLFNHHSWIIWCKPPGELSTVVCLSFHPTLNSLCAIWTEYFTARPHHTPRKHIHSVFAMWEPSGGHSEPFGISPPSACNKLDSDLQTPFKDPESAMQIYIQERHKTASYSTSKWTVSKISIHKDVLLSGVIFIDSLVLQWSMQRSYQDDYSDYEKQPFQTIRSHITLVPEYS